MTKAPWTDELVEALKWYQTCEVSHPYTCNCPTSPVLSVTKDGFVCEKCGRKQDWCMDDMIGFVVELKKHKQRMPWMI